MRKSAPLTPTLSPNGGEGQGEGEVIFSEQEVRQRFFLTIGLRITSSPICNFLTGHCWDSGGFKNF
jgi:hypothetical protein